MAETEILEGVDPQAWERWVSYRKAIKKPIKDASARAMQLKLLRFGDKEKQAKVVDQSIGNQWQGLFDLVEKPERAEPGKPRAKTLEEQTRDAMRHAAMVSKIEKSWDRIIATPIGKLKLADALLARYSVQDDQSDIALADAREYLKMKVGEILRVADPREVLNEPPLWSLVLQLFGRAGIHRLEQRAAA